jgi:hypothetical protein
MECDRRAAGEIEAAQDGEALQPGQGTALVLRQLGGSAHFSSPALKKARQRHKVRAESSG